MMWFGFIAVLVLTFHLPAANAETLRWRMSAEHPSANFNTKLAEEFAQNVKRVTNGELDITVVASSALAKRPEVAGKLETGEFEIGDVLLSAVDSEDPLFALDSLPFLATSPEQARLLWEVTRQAIEERLMRRGIRVLYAVPWPPQNLYTNQAVNRMADFEGKGFRSYNPTLSRMATLMGAKPLVLTTYETPDAFRSGKIMAMMTSATTSLDLKAWTFTTHLYDIRAFIPKNVVMVNEAAFQKLSPRVQRGMLNAARRAEIQGREISGAIAAYQQRMLKRMGLTIVSTLPPELDKGFERIGATLIADWVAQASEEDQALIERYWEKVRGQVSE